MPYCLDIKFCDEWVKVCVCGVICEGLYRGTRWNYEAGRPFPFNRWLCEQCRDDIRDDGNEIREIQNQSVSPDQWDAWEIWYEKEKQAGRL